MHNKDFQAGKTYHLNDGGGNYILRATGPGNTSSYIFLEGEQYGSGSDFMDSKNYREATQEETEWLGECIRAKKFVKNPSILTYSVY